MSKIKSFKGLLADGGQHTILLRTNDGKTGYKIVKFQIMPEQSNNNYELTTKIFTIEQTAVTSAVDLSDQTCLAAAFAGLASGAYAGAQTIIHDNITFNQDIYITSKDDSGSQACNYYIELEKMALDLNESTVATLKDIRNND